MCKLWHTRFYIITYVHESTTERIMMEDARIFAKQGMINRFRLFLCFPDFCSDEYISNEICFGNHVVI
ncbi:hypothetical protein ACS0TY_021553 [Phlomoides rotata]